MALFDTPKTGKFEGALSPPLRLLGTCVWNGGQEGVVEWTGHVFKMNSTTEPYVNIVTVGV